MTRQTDAQKKAVKRQANRDWIAVDRILARLGKDLMITMIRLRKPTLKWSSRTGLYSPTLHGEETP